MPLRAAFLILVFTTAAAADGPVDDVIALVKAGMSEALILKNLRTQNKAIDLTPEDLVKLQGAKVSEKIIATMMDPGGAPAAPNASSLRSLAGARKIEERCEVLQAWLDAGRGAGRSPLVIFRDEPMTAVFGVTYDKTDARWRAELQDKTIAHCRAAGMGSYQAMLGQAFGGAAGPYEAGAISRYVQQVRSQMDWANKSMAWAAGVPASREAFEKLREQSREAWGQLAALDQDEKARVIEYLASRQSAIAPALAEDWLAGAGRTEKTVAGAKTLQQNRAEVDDVVRALDATARATWDGKFERLMDSMLAESVRGEVAKLEAIPATLAGIPQTAQWKTAFDKDYREFRSFAVVQGVESEFGRARARVMAGALPVWVSQVNTIPVDAAAIVAKRREMEGLLGAQERPAEFENALRAKEEQLRAQAAAASRQQQEARVAATRAAVVAPAPAQTVRTQSEAAREGNLVTSGLSNERAVRALYLGDFSKIDFDRDDTNFSVMFGKYLESYSQKCALPENKVPMTQEVCDDEREIVTRNGYGTIVNRTSRCYHYKTVLLGYAKPELYEAKKGVERMRAADAGRQISRMMGQIVSQNPMAGAVAMIGGMQAASSDMAALVKMNDCGGPGLERFEQNLMRFAQNKQPIRMGGEPVAPAVTGGPFKDQNYTKLIEELVEDDAKKWGGFAKFVYGSVSGASVRARDGEGRPASVVARYSWDGLARTQGSVTLTFSDGMPECLTYSETPTVCHAPNRRISAAYAEGAYSQ